MIIGGCCGLRVVFDLCNWFYTGLPPNSYFSFSLPVMGIKKRGAGREGARQPDQKRIKEKKEIASPRQQLGIRADV